MDLRYVGLESLINKLTTLKRKEVLLRIYPFLPEYLIRIGYKYY
jgi:hypothetical protein